MKWTIPLALITTLLSGQPTPSRAAIIGRWDLTVRGNRGNRAAWLEVRHSGIDTLVGQFVGTAGSARPISKVEFTDGNLRFSIPPQWERIDGEVVVAGRLDGDRLKGTITAGSGQPVEWTGVRAPDLRRTSPPRWGRPIRLVNGGDLSGWHAVGRNEWEVSEGTLRNRESGGNLVTDRTFDDFKLHLDFRYPKDSNSGIYLRGRYEVQIIDLDEEPTGLGSLGAVYGFVAPNQPSGRKAGDWQTFDITLVGRLVTVVLNGRTIICGAEIPGITGGALDSREGEPGPLYLQGDHGSIEFRNVVISPAR